MIKKKKIKMHNFQTPLGFLDLLLILSNLYFRFFK